MRIMMVGREGGGGGQDPIDAADHVWLWHGTLWETSCASEMTKSILTAQ